MKRILVIRGGAIGDFVLTLPAIKLLRDAHPQARLEILGYTHIAALAETRFYADAIRSIEYGPLARFFAKDSILPKDLVDYFGRFHLVVSYLFDPDRIFERNVHRCGVENFLACSPKIHAGESASVQLARPLEQLGLIAPICAPRLFPSTADRAVARSSYPEEKLIALHPGSGSESKNWPIHNWIALFDRLPASRVAPAFLVVAGEADNAQSAKFRALPRSDLRFAENLPLPHLAAVLERCKLFIGHDSGISHIAAAVGTQCLLLFGPSDPAVWAPQNKNARVLTAGSGRMSDLSLAEVDAELSAASFTN